MALVAGIDIGSLTAKIIVLDTNKNSNTKSFSQLKKVGYAPGNIASGLIMSAQSYHTGQKIDYIVSTGYGRKLVENADKIITEITCHAVGAHHSDPSIQTIIDIGGQDSKVIRVNEQGQVQDFEMNDKCSAGSGRFLEVMASALEVSIEEFGSLGLRSTSPSKISSTCTVFAESEVISRINQGANRNDIVAGIHESIVNKIIALAARVGIQPEISLTGGVALNPAVKRMLERELDVKLKIPAEPQMNGAFGAAILALRYYSKLV
ncbi:2-hydroxyglutaryl-CoA dehydratase [Candidatus Heimdallarchaeota archaeon B3_Heim]|nr:MAG: 2-hydroxyglutaryl-CoA dehydratase [Candidatus Heimdallarchaeota archaeon B3_Heim]